MRPTETGLPDEHEKVGGRLQGELRGPETYQSFRVREPPVELREPGEGFPLSEFIRF